MIVWSIQDIVGIAFWVLIILIFILVCIANVIKDKLHNIFRKNKTDKESEGKGYNE
jgi:Na+-transporting methylmalonyl-CoA/oxaloacetate decarboxylase gamma subunit